MKKAQTTFIVVLLIIIAVALIVIAYNSVNPSVTGQVVKEEKVAEVTTITEEDFSFIPLWRNTNKDCQSNYETGEVSYLLEINKDKIGVYHCNIQLDDKNPHPISFSRDVEMKDNAYMGRAEVFESHKITLCCSLKQGQTIYSNTICKTENLKPLC